MSEHDRYDPQALLAHMGWLRGLARQLVADQQLADDLAHDTYVIAMEGSPSNPAHLRGWLRGVLVRLVSRLRRNELRRQDVELVHAPRERLEATDALVEKVEAQGELVRLVLELDEAYREVVLLRYFEELPADRIAVQLGLPATTVRRRLAHALEQLRGRLERSLGKDPQLWSLALLGVPLGGKATLLTQSGGTALVLKLALAVVVLAGAVTVGYVALRGEAGDSVLSAPTPEAAGPRAAAQPTGGAGAEAAPQVPVREPLLAAGNAPDPQAPDAPAGAVAPVEGAAARLGRLRTAMEASLAGDLDVAALVDAAWPALEHDPVPGAAPALELGGSMRYALATQTDGLQAQLKIDRTANPGHDDPTLSLRLTLDPPGARPYLVAGGARERPQLELSPYSDDAGRLLGLRITTEFLLAATPNRELGYPLPLGRTPVGFYFSYLLEDPLASSARATWIEDDALRSGDAPWRLVGGPLPPRATLERLAARLHELHDLLRR